MLVCFVTQIVFSSLFAPLVSYLDVITAQCGPLVLRVLHLVRLSSYWHNYFSAMRPSFFFLAFLNISTSRINSAFDSRSSRSLNFPVLSKLLCSLIDVTLRASCSINKQIKHKKGGVYCSLHWSSLWPTCVQAQLLSSSNPSFMQLHKTSSSKRPNEIFIQLGSVHHSKGLSLIDWCYSAFPGMTSGPLL